MISRLTELVRSFDHPRVLVVGDLLLDRYLWGKVDRISPEAPIPVLSVVREEERPGGAANVANNLVALGAEAVCAGAVGADGAGLRLVDLMAKAGIDAAPVVVEKSKPTPVKTRCISQSQQMLRVDNEMTSALSAGAQAELVKRLEKEIAKAKLVIVSDYDKGCLTESVLSSIMKIAKKQKKFVLVGPKGTGYAKYKGATAIAPNLKELRLATGLPAGTDDEIAAAAGRLIEETDAQFLLVTRGDKGMSLFRRSGVPFHVSGRARQVYDVAGAGDTSVATLGLALACGASPEDAVRLANTAGGLAVTKVGVAAVSRAEILEDLAEEHHMRPDKIRTVEDLLPRLAEHRDRQEKIVFTNGCFDILHLGHIRTLHFAKSQGDILVVGLNTDASVKGQKPGRPLVPQAERAQVLAALEDVDYVVLFEEKSVEPLIRKVKPDVLVKGGDYAASEVVGKAFVESGGGKVVVAPLEKGLSTTNIVEKIRKSIT